MKIFILYCFFNMFPLLTFAKTWYVSEKGNDLNDGTSLKAAFRSLQRAADIVNPGDEVLIDDGVYTNDDFADGSGVLLIHRSGTADAWIYWKAMPGCKPIIKPLGWAGILVTSSYNSIDGITIVGLNDEIAMIDAFADSKKERATGRFNTNGIYFNGRLSTPDSKPHHLAIRNCTIKKCPGGGITAIEFDYLTVEDCVVAENCWNMRYAGSGITTLNNWAFDDDPGYHIIIQRNYVWNNRCLVPWERIGKHSDGNGILLDVTNIEGEIATNPNADTTIKGQEIARKKNLRPEWKGRALIANNISAYNGGSGIHTFQTKHVDIINNTTYHNGCVVNYEELFPNRSEDIVIMNNIIIPRPGGRVTSDNRNKDVRWDYNLYPVKQSIFVGAHDIIADPEFVNIQYDLTRGGFMLKKQSPAVNTGCDEIPQQSDIRHKLRKNTKRDRGAYEQ